MLTLLRSRVLSSLCVGWLLTGSAGITTANAAVEKTLRIGVSLPPYYSWVRNLVTEQTEVVPILAAGNDPHVYQPLPEDIRKLATLDALVVNGLGHDEFVTPMLAAVGEAAPVLITLNEGIPWVPAKSAGSNSTAVNSHTFLSITGAIHQTSNLASALQQIDPANAEHYRRKARAYKRRLRKLHGAALTELKKMRVDDVRIGTVHDGYTYLFEDLGMTVHAVVQPRHGVHPSPRQLADSIQRIKAAGINLLFAELAYEQQFVDLVLEETNTRIARLSHISRGPYTAEYYEIQMAENLRQILDVIRALQ